MRGSAAWYAGTTRTRVALERAEERAGEGR
jgi:hypothetical protein